jgi:Gluconate 2-dehydrogenase subunit 3
VKELGPGYYPGYHSLSQQKYWDAATRHVILDRVDKIPEIRFFQAEQLRLMEAVCARILPQDDRDPDHRIPIVPGIDQRLFKDEHDGYRFEDMPPDQEAYELGLKGIDQIAQHLHGRGFCEIGIEDQDRILESLHDARPAAAHEIWKKMAVHRFWMLLVQDCVTQYYSHPRAWDEIGFGGPAYPRAYMRLERGEPEPWEKSEERRDWKAPGSSLSDKFSYIAGLAEHLGGPQGGTH